MFSRFYQALPAFSRPPPHTCLHAPPRERATPNELSPRALKPILFLCQAHRFCDVYRSSTSQTRQNTKEVFPGVPCGGYGHLHLEQVRAVRRLPLAKSRWEPRRRRSYGSTQSTHILGRPSHVCTLFRDASRAKSSYSPRTPAGFIRSVALRYTIRVTSSPKVSLTCQQNFPPAPSLPPFRRKLRRRNIACMDEMMSLLACFKRCNFEDDRKCAGEKKKLDDCLIFQVSLTPVAWFIFLQLPNSTI